MDTADGFSHKVIRLEACRTNRNPMVVAAMCVKAVKSLGLVSEIFRTDHGNEFGVIATVHCTFR